MKIYQAALDVQVEIHAGSEEEAAERRERLVETLSRLLSDEPALHAMGVTHFRVDLGDTFREKPQGDSLAAAYRRSDAVMTPTGQIAHEDRHAAALGDPDQAPDATPAHYLDNSAATASGTGGGETNPA